MSSTPNRSVAREAGRVEAGGDRQRRRSASRAPPARATRRGRCRAARDDDRGSDAGQGRDDADRDCARPRPAETPSGPTRVSALLRPYQRTVRPLTTVDPASAATRGEAHLPDKTPARSIAPRTRAPETRARFEPRRRTYMSTLVAIAYPDAATAEQVRGELVQLTKEHLLTARGRRRRRAQARRQDQAPPGDEPGRRRRRRRRPVGRPDRPDVPRAAARHGDRRRRAAGSRAR